MYGCEEQAIRLLEEEEDEQQQQKEEEEDDDDDDDDEVEEEELEEKGKEEQSTVITSLDTLIRILTLNYYNLRNKNVLLRDCIFMQIINISGLRLLISSA
jgi:hypothetical protein